MEKSVGDEIMNLGLSGVKVDEDYRRYYPYGSLASKVLGFTGADNQGIIGLEVMYEKYLKGQDGLILTLSDAKGTELQNAAEERVEPVPGNTLTVSLDVNIQKYAEQAAYQVMEKKGAKAVSVIVMNPRNGEIYAMVNVPEFDLNDPFTLNVESGGLTGTELQDARNKMWRNRCINDTYEPGSTFKIITAAAGLEAGVVHLDDRFSCPGFRIVEDRKIRCHKIGGHGGETFLQGAMNSCNPVFIDVARDLAWIRSIIISNSLGFSERPGSICRRGSDDHAQEGKYGTCGARHRLLWTVLSDHADPAHHDGVLHHKRGQADHAALRDECGEHGWDILPEVFLSGADGSRVGSYQRDHAVYFRAGSGGRKRKAGEASRLPGRRKDGDIGEAAEKLKEVYFFFSRICAGR